MLGTSGGQPSIFPPCNQVSSTYSDIHYDRYGRVTEFDFDIECTDGSGHYTGHVYNVEYNNIGQALSFDATINGQQCHWP
jgi:hypothetical protein